jgi:predicted nucleic acid-binding protein
MDTLVDVNVLLELILPDRPKAPEAARFLGASENLVLSPLTAHLYVYFGKKAGLDLNDLVSDLANYRFTNFGAQEVAWAAANRQSNDYEDALQVACAIAHGCKSIVTLDKKLARQYAGFINVQLLDK